MVVHVCGGTYEVLVRVDLGRRRLKVVLRRRIGRQRTATVAQGRSGLSHTEIGQRTIRISREDYHRAHTIQGVPLPLLPDCSLYMSLSHVCLYVFLRMC